MDGSGAMLSVSEWTLVVRKKPNKQGKNDFVNRYMSIIYTLLHNAPILYNIKRIPAIKPRYQSGGSVPL